MADKDAKNKKSSRQNPEQHQAEREEDRTVAEQVPPQDASSAPKPATLDHEDQSDVPDCCGRNPRSRGSIPRHLHRCLGRGVAPIGHISHNLNFDNLAQTVREVLQSLSSFEAEVQTKSGNWYRMAILVHRTDEHVIEGVVLTFINIDMQKKAQQTNGK